MQKDPRTPGRSQPDNDPLRCDTGHVGQFKPDIIQRSSFDAWIAGILQRQSTIQINRCQYIPPGIIEERRPPGHPGSRSDRPRSGRELPRPLEDRREAGISARGTCNRCSPRTGARTGAMCAKGRVNGRTKSSGEPTTPVRIARLVICARFAVFLGASTGWEQSQSLLVLENPTSLVSSAQPSHLH